jgi:hypothetical protein
MARPRALPVGRRLCLEWGSARTEEGMEGRGGQEEGRAGNGAKATHGYLIGMLHGLLLGTLIYGGILHKYRNMSI